MIAAGRIKERLLEIETNVRLLAELQGTPVDVFVGDPKIYKLAERCFQLAIECMIDVADHLIVERGWPRPETGREALLTLGREGVLPPEYARRLVPLASLRKLILQGYPSLDRRVLHSHLSRLDDFTEFIRRIDAYLTASA
jgi:uncharacterized protein YutE (UPF0331/DUF86 family)